MTCGKNKAYVNTISVIEIYEIVDQLITNIDICNTNTITFDMFYKWIDDNMNNIGNNIYIYI